MKSRSVVFFFLLVFLSVSALAAPEQWVEVRSSHFTVLTDSNEKRGRDVLDQFERMRWVFQTLFPNINVDPAAPIVVFAAKNGKIFQAFEPEAYLAKGQLSLAGYFLSTQDRNYVLLRLDAEQEHPYATIYHEYTHLQFKSASDWMPLWLNEGFAEFFQNTDIHHKDVLLGQPSIDDIEYLRQQKLIPLPVLFKVDAGSPYYHEEQKGSVFYAESWALTHYLQVTDKEKGTNRVFDYVRLMSHHEDSVAAAEKAFGDLSQLQRALESYIHANSYRQFIMNSTVAQIDEASYQVRTLTQVEADAARADVLANVHREKEARELIDSILKADPNNVQVRETLGMLEFRAGKNEEARKWFSEAVKFDSKSFLANYYFAAMSMDLPGADEDSAIEASLRSAINLNPKFAPAYDRLAVYRALNRHKPEEGLPLSQRAVQLDPGNLYYRLNEASILSVLERYVDANTVLQAAAKVAKNPGELGIVQGHIEELRQMQQARAQAAQAQREAEAEQADAQKRQVEERVVLTNQKPAHPNEANGPRHTALGVIHGVSCSYPAALQFQLDNAKKTLTLYNNDFAKIDLTVVGFSPAGTMNPCTDFEGFKARIQYAESADKTVDGQVFAIELRK
jgi:tetratricopeptide (TPR) repeat protein